MYDVAVIGAGVVGAMIARSLSRYRLRVCVLEKENDVAMGSTRANSAIVHAGFDAEEGSLKALLNVEGAKAMAQVCRQLGVKYENNGSLVIGFTEEDRNVIIQLLHRGRANGVEGLEILEREALLALEPNLSGQVLCALHAPTGGIVCPYELTIAAMGNAMDNGVELLRNFEVKHITAEDPGYTLAGENGTVKARFVVNCAGLYSDAVAAMAGDDSFRVHPRRGEYILLDKECGTLVRHTIFRTPSIMGKGILVSPTVDGNLLLGPTSVDMEDKENKDTTAQGLSEILGSAFEDLKAVPVGKTITSFCGLRAVGSTGDFIITSPKPGFINAAGIESPGLSASPAIARYILDMLAAQGLELEADPGYDPIRPPAHGFREATLEEKNEMIRRDPAYGRILCRCESVTEGEILDAIRRNPGARDMDGVKRRTRAQMGRCQGGFCGPLIAQLLARELEIPFTQVTKFGGGSYINIATTKGGQGQ